MQHYHNLPTALPSALSQSAVTAVGTAVIQALAAMKLDDQKREAESRGWFKRIRGVFGAIAFAIGYAVMNTPRGFAMAEAVVPWEPVVRNSQVSDFYRLGTNDESAVKHFVREFPYFAAGRALVLHEVALWPLSSLPQIIRAELAGKGPRYEWRPDAR